MKLENKVRYVKKLVRENKDLIAVGSLFALTSIGDAYLTAKGLEAGIATEGNPLVQFFIDNLGTAAGLGTIKAGVGISAILACKKGRNYVSKHVANLPLYIGTIAQTGAMLSWIYPEKASSIVNSILNYL